MINKDVIIEMLDKDKVLKFFRDPLRLGIGIVGLILLVILGASIFSSDEALSGIPTYRVQKGPLRISVTESGSIEAREKIVLKNEVEGTTSIIFLIDEGTRVKKGDLLVELDASQLIDQKVDQEIQVQNAEASFISARENLEVVKNQAESDVDKAQLDYDFAIQDLKKYLEGDYPNELKDAENKITISKEEVERAREKVQWSRKLYEEAYISQTELQADELSEKRTVLDLELAENALDLLKNYTRKRKLAQLESDVDQNKMALERVMRKVKADIVQAESNLKAKEAEYKRQQDKLEKIKTQIEKAKIYAPADGQVLYATSSSGHRPWDRDEPLDEGQQVRERQDLIHLPTSTGFNAEIGVHEASLDKVRVGLPAKITVDALPGVTFTGRVVTISPLPDAQSSFMNPDLKIYNTTIELDNGGDMNLLRAGMNCTVEIIVDQYKETLYVPIQAVIRVGGQPTVYVVDGDELEPKNVEIGLDNNSMIRIVSGLEVGERVSLTPPLTEGAVEAAKYDEDLEIPEAPEGGTGTPTGMNMPGQIDDSPSGGFSGGDEQGRGFPAGDQQGSSQRSSGLPGGVQQGMRFPAGEQQGGSPQGRGFPAGGQPFGNPMEMLDTDKDGKVSKEEFPMPDRFSGIDKDGDGYITESEFSAAWQQRSGQQGGGFPGGGRQGGEPPSDFPGGDQ
ncbi:MAG: HlyD family secretion protein [Deltaproteobacteria bacterium]|nr:HlyD family secretion protein [Deltaproteobacteria bacterium]